MYKAIEHNKFLHNSINKQDPEEYYNVSRSNSTPLHDISLVSTLNRGIYDLSQANHVVD